MESKTPAIITSVKTIHSDGSMSIDSNKDLFVSASVDSKSNGQKKSTKGRKSVLKVNDFKQESDLARYTKKVKDIVLPSNFIKRQVDVSTVKTLIKTTKKTITELNHQDVEYDDNRYTVCYVSTNQKPVLFIIDTNIKEKVISNNVCVRDGYPRLESQFIHQLVMGNPPSDKYSVDHLNRIRRDDRKCNLAFKTASEQLQNQFIRDRTVELPEDCGIVHNDIPKNVFYINEKDKGEYFEINIKGVSHLPKNILKKKTTSRSDVPLRIKLQTAIYYLRWLCQQYPELKSVIRINKEDEEQRIKLTKEYNDIISLTSYPKEVINANVVDFIYDCKTDYSIDNEEIIEKIVKNTEAGKKKEDNLPADSGVNKTDIPKYCYYVPAKESRGDKFVIDSHPKLLETGKRQMGTPETKLLTTKQKFDMLLEYIRCLENDLPIPKYEGPKGVRGQFTDIKKKEKPIVQKIDKPSNADNVIDVNTKDIPRYVYYKPADKEHGSYWIIKDHPNLSSRNIKTKNSRTSALLGDREKFEEILCHLESLEKDTPFKEYKVVRAVKNSVHKEKSTKRAPENWDLENYPIAEYLYYCPPTDKRSDSWIIRGHPKQTKASISTSTSKDKSTLDKYLESRAIVNKLEYLD
jgi:hypothetical protein